MSELNVCMILKPRKMNDDKMRPGTNSPDLHWANRLVDSVSDKCDSGHTIPPAGVYTRYGEEGLEVILEPGIDPTIFKHIMKFARSNDLTYEFPNNMKRCSVCPGHTACLANQHKLD